MLKVSVKNPDCKNVNVSKDELEKIRQLGDLDLQMLLSEIHDFGWPNGGRALLPLIWKSHLKEARKSEK